MKQQTFSDFEYSNRKRKTKREEFLEIMDEIIPWDEWVGIIMPFYPSGKRGRPPKGIELMLRMYLLQMANVHDIQVTSKLIREDDEVVYGDSGYLIIKCLFGYRKVAYKGLAKNENRLYALFASANLYALASRGRSLAEAW